MFNFSIMKGNWSKSKEKSNLNSVFSIDEKLKSKCRISITSKIVAVIHALMEQQDGDGRTLADEELRVELLLLHIERDVVLSLWRCRWSSHWRRTTKDTLKDPPEELEEASGETEVWTFLLRLCLDQARLYVSANGCIEPLFQCI